MVLAEQLYCYDFDFSLLPSFIWSDHMVIQQWGNLRIFLICQMGLSVKNPLGKCKLYYYVWTCCIKYTVELGLGQIDKNWGQLIASIDFFFFRNWKVIFSTSLSNMCNYEVE